MGLYQNENLLIELEEAKLPSPLEVYRFISQHFQGYIDAVVVEFPSPREAYRFISNGRTNKSNQEMEVTVPSRGE